MKMIIYYFNNTFRGTALEGLHPVLIHFIETLRHLLHLYQTARNNEDLSVDEQNEQITEILNSSDFDDLSIIAFNICEKSFKFLIQEMIGSFEDQYSGDTTRRIVLFVIFLIILLITFLALWTPFVNKLNKEVS
jgi:hypothetical protein